MKLYCGIDLHSNNSVIVILDETDKVIYQKKLNNDLELILQQLSTFIDDIVAIAIESTFNWYWLVDGLQAAGYEVKLVNTTAVQTYSGLKFTDDKHDARWLAHLLRLDILPTGYIYHKGRTRRARSAQKTQSIGSTKHHQYIERTKYTDAKCRTITERLLP